MDDSSWGFHKWLLHLWMLYFMEYPFVMDGFGGIPISGNLHIVFLDVDICELFNEYMYMSIEMYLLYVYIYLYTYTDSHALQYM